MEGESGDTNTRVLSLSTKRVKDSSSHWHCPPQTEASIICNIKNDFSDPKETSSSSARHSMVLVRMLNLGPPPCRVISSRRQALSAPLHHFTYDYREKAFTNREGYTWTPMYLHYCKPLITEQLHGNNQFLETNRNIANTDHLKRPKREVSAQLFSLLTSNSTIIKAPFWTQGKLGTSVTNCKPISYSKFMESPYIQKRKYSL